MGEKRRNGSRGIIKVGVEERKEANIVVERIKGEEGGEVGWNIIVETTKGSRKERKEEKRDWKKWRGAEWEDIVK